MGYYTTFHLEVVSVPSEQRDALALEIGRMNVFAAGNLDDGYHEDAKWYGSDDDMLLLSARFPDAVFSLEGYGENYDDHWLEYYHAGRVQRKCLHVIIDDYDPSKLDGEPPLDTGQRYSYET